jgi:hypothetical protein
MRLVRGNMPVPALAAVLPAIGSALGLGGGAAATGAAATGAAATGAAATGAATGGAASAGGGLLSRIGASGIKEGVKSKVKEDGAEMAINTLNSAKERDAAARDQQIQGAKDAARRGAEITSGTTKKSQYHYADWVLEGPMHDAWSILKARMEIGPHDEQQDELFEHLKNINGGHSIRTNEEDNSFMLDDVHEDDEDVVRRLIQSFGRNFADGTPVTEEKEEKEPRFF